MKEVEYKIDKITESKNKKGFNVLVKHRLLGEKDWDNMSCNFDKKDIENDNWLSIIKDTIEADNRDDLSDIKGFEGKVFYVKKKDE